MAVFFMSVTCKRRTQFDTFNGDRHHWSIVVCNSSSSSSITVSVEMQGDFRKSTKVTYVSNIDKNNYGK